jgi:hypothetical protein
MCQNSKLEIVSQSDFGYIGQCTGCKKFNLVFGNVFLLLVDQELEALGRMLEDQFGIYYHGNPIGHGKHISLSTPLQNMYMAFSFEEFNTFKTMVAETNLVIQARSILYNSYRKTGK